MNPGGPIDAPRPVRPGEEIPVDRLALWLAENDPGLAGPLAVEQFPGGHSNLTYLLHIGDRELVLRRPPVGSRVRTAHDMGREFRILSRLHTVYPQAPRALLHCDDPAVIGAPFYLMERVRGLVLRAPRLPPGLELPPPAMRRLSESVVDGLAELHAIDPAAAGLGDLGRPEGYVARQVAGWRERWVSSKTDEVPAMETASTWLGDHLPPEREAPRATLIHNDFKYDNLVLAEDLSEIRAVLDWEMATLGDPRMDLGTALGYWMDADDDPALQRLPAGPTTVPGNLTRREVAERYAANTGRDPGDLVFFYAFGVFKIAVIAQQIYARYRQGLTADPRFAGLLDAVRILGTTAARAVELGRIDRLS